MNQSNDILFQKTIEVRWADCDANHHMRHSAYADFCAHARVCFLDSIGLDAEWCKKHQLGPILFKEQTEYKREVKMAETLKVTVEASEATGFSKSIQLKQSLFKESGELAAEHWAVLAWMDLNVRKIVELPEPLVTLFPVIKP